MMIQDEVVFITASAAGIGKACAEALLSAGAFVAGVDINPSVETTFDDEKYLGITADVTDETAMQTAIEHCIEKFGGLDILVANAGIMPKSIPLTEIKLEDWRKAMSINIDATVTLLRDAHPQLKQSANGGRIVLMGSKSYLAPGKNSVMYSCSKASLTQLGRIAAIEWADDGIRVFILHPNRVVDTDLWLGGTIEARAASYGMTVEEYKRDTMLGVEIISEDVANMVVAVCGPAFAKSTGLQIPIDGGNLRII